MSCAGNGYLSGNMLVPFPFEDGQTLAWSSGSSELDAEAQRLLERCFADAFVNAYGADIEDGWPSIGGFSAGDSRMSFSICAGGMSASVTISDSASRFPILSGRAPFGSYVVVMSSEGLRDFLSFCSEKSISPPAPGSSSPSVRDGVFLRLCARCAAKSPSGLTSIRVFDGVNPKSSGPHFVLKGNISVIPGNNMLISDPDENGMQIGAVPGAGMGTVPCSCEDVASVKSPIMSPDGHTRIFNDTCYDIEPWIESVIENGKVVKRIGHIQLHAKCTACCTCEMYESIVNDRLVPIARLVRLLRTGGTDDDGNHVTGLGELLTSYEKAVKRFNQRLQRPMASDVRLSLSGMPVGANLSPKLADTGVKGRMGRCAFTAILRNSSYSVISATVISISGSDSVVEVSVSWTDENGAPRSKTVNSSSDMVNQKFSVMPGMSLVVTFVSVKNEMVGSASTGGYKGSISVGVSYSTEGGPSGSLGILRKSVEV